MREDHRDQQATLEAREVDGRTALATASEEVVPEVADTTRRGDAREGPDDPFSDAHGVVDADFLDLGDGLLRPRHQVVGDDLGGPEAPVGEERSGGSGVISGVSVTRPHDEPTVDEPIPA